MVRFKRVALGISFCNVPLDPAIPHQKSILGSPERDLDYLDFVHRDLDYKVVPLGVTEN